MTNGDYCVPGNAVPTVKMTLGICWKRSLKRINIWR